MEIPLIFINLRYFIINSLPEIQDLLDFKPRIIYMKNNLYTYRPGMEMKSDKIYRC